MPDLKNKSTRVVNVAGLSIAPGRTGTVPMNHYQSWLLRSSQNRETAAECLEVRKPGAPGRVRAPQALHDPQSYEKELPPGSPQDREARIDRGIGLLGEGDFDMDGQPNLARLRTITGLDDLTEDERSARWRAFVESQGGPPASPPPKDETAPDGPEEGAEGAEPSEEG